MACCCACGASCTIGPFRAAATSNIKEALCGVFMSDTSLFRGRSAAFFPSVLDAQAALVAKGWNPDKFQIVEEETNPKSEIQ